MTQTDAQPAHGPYSPLREANNFYFVSGQVGVDPKTAAAPHDIAAQTHQVLQNMRTVLESHGLGLRDVIKTIIFVTDIDDFAAVNEVYAGYFSAPRPARSLVGVRELPKVGGNIPIKIEIEAIAYRPPQAKE